MPYRRRSYKKRRRRRSFKKARFRRRNRRLKFSSKRSGKFTDLRTRAPFPTKKAVLMRYIPPNAIKLGDGSTSPNNMLPQYHIFSANGVYDPDITYVGHQACGFDQMKQYYSHYTVVASQIKVTFSSLSSNPMTCFVHVKNDKTPVMDLREIFEGGDVKLTRLGVIKEGTITYRINPNKFLGISKPLSNSLVRGAPTKNPDEGVYFHVGVAAQERNQPTGPVLCNVQISYSVVWTEPKRIGVSLKTADEPEADPVNEAPAIAPHTHTYTDHDDIAHGTGTPNITETSDANPL